MSDKEIEELRQQTKENILTTLGKKAGEMTTDEFILLIYNHAIDDACNFVEDLAQSNPPHRVSFMSILPYIRKLEI